MAEATTQRPPNRAPAPPDAPKDVKEAPPKDDKSTFEYGVELAVIIIVCFNAALYLSKLINSKNFTVTGLFYALLDKIMASPAGPVIRDIAVAYISLANILLLFFLTMIVYSLIKVRKIRMEWYAALNPQEATASEQEVKNERWQRVLAHASSSNPSDWRLAVLEADIVLDDLLDQEGYIGDTIGDKLKKAVRGDFKTLDQAWEAHRIRNAIAHEGQDFVLTQREAQRILGLYEEVFKEFNFV